jgi:hypothetical protein
MIVWGDGVVPLTIELGAFDVGGSHFCIRYDNAAGVFAVSSVQRQLSWPVGDN